MNQEQLIKGIEALCIKEGFASIDDAYSQLCEKEHSQNKSPTEGKQEAQAGP